MKRSQSVETAQAIHGELLFCKASMRNEHELKESNSCTNLKCHFVRYIDDFLSLEPRGEKWCGYTNTCGEQLSGQGYRWNKGRASDLTKLMMWQYLQKSSIRRGRLGQTVRKSQTYSLRLQQCLTLPMECGQRTKTIGILELVSTSGETSNVPTPGLLQIGRKRKKVGESYIRRKDGTPTANGDEPTYPCQYT